MFSLLRSAAARSPTTLPLFPLKTVLFPGGMLPLKVFEQRYIEMTKSCLKDETPFGVCLLKDGEEVARPGHAAKAPEFAVIGTLARITACDVPQLGIMHLRTEGGARCVKHPRIAGSDEWRSCMPRPKVQRCGDLDHFDEGTRLMSEYAPH